MEMYLNATRDTVFFDNPYSKNFKCRLCNRGFKPNEKVT